jgi:hypothetical protein
MTSRSHLPPSMPQRYTPSVQVSGMYKEIITSQNQTKSSTFLLHNHISSTLHTSRKTDNKNANIFTNQQSHNRRYHDAEQSANNIQNISDCVALPPADFVFYNHSLRKHFLCQFGHIRNLKQKLRVPEIGNVTN